MKPFIEILTRSPVTLALFLNFARPPLIEPGIQGIGSRPEVIPNTNKHGRFSKKSDFWKGKTEICSWRHFVSRILRENVCGQIDWVI